MLPIAENLSDKIQIGDRFHGPNNPCSVLSTFLGSGSSLFFIVVSLIVLGMGFGFFSSPNTNAVMSSVEKVLWPWVCLLGTMTGGQMFSMGVALHVYIGRKAIAPEYYPVFLKMYENGLHHIARLYAF